MVKPTHVLVIANSLRRSQAVELCQTAKDSKVKFSLAGIMPRIPTAYYQMPSTSEIEQRLGSETEVKVAGIGRLLGVAKEDRFLIKQHRNAVQALAKELDAHLIINDNPPSLMTRLYIFITGKKPPRKAGDIPTIRSQEYLDIINSTLKKTQAVKEQTVVQTKVFAKTPYTGITPETLPTDNLPNWIPEKTDEKAKQPMVSVNKSEYLH